MQLTFLGTGTSMGVPVIGCRCAVCTSANPRNRRLRTSALLEVAGLSIMIDAGPDFRQQALAVGLQRLDAILLTHAHADHVLGIDDLRPINLAQQAPMPLFGNAQTLAFVRSHFDYAFVNGSVGSTRPMLELQEIQAGQSFRIEPVQVLPIEVQHGSWNITSYRIGGLGYVTDASAITEESRAALRGCDVLVLNALRHQPHPTHFSVEEAVAVIEDLGPRQAFLVHMTHDLDYDATNAILPSHVQLAYDGLCIAVDEAHGESNPVIQQVVLPE